VNVRHEILAMTAIGAGRARSERVGLRRRGACSREAHRICIIGTPLWRGLEFRHSDRPAAKDRHHCARELCHAGIVVCRLLCPGRPSPQLVDVNTPGPGAYMRRICGRPIEALGACKRGCVRMDWIRFTQSAHAGRPQVLSGECACV